jgi:hypothetical protein
MSKKTLKIVLSVFWIICVLLIIVGAVGAGLGHTAFYASLFFGLGLIIPVTIELVPLYKPNSDKPNSDKPNSDTPHSKN